MQQNVRNEIGDLVKRVLADYNGGKNIDATDIFNKPDRNEVIDIVNNLFFIMYPGYFKDITYKFYNPENGIALMLEDIFYRLNKQVALAIDFKGLMTEEQRKAESFLKATNFSTSMKANRLKKVTNPLLILLHSVQKTEVLRTRMYRK